ncbi:unnamed protein product [Auanema sp. JU1783]|nr:unnamed protein product [Auanema sp. JU1783]
MINSVDQLSSYDYNQLILYVNGKRYEESNIDPKTTLAVYLRDHLKLTGTKIGCNEGGCGACTVMISEIEPFSGNLRHYSANACLMPICGVFGKAVTTVEGLGSVVSKKLHPVQERLSKAHGSQCGFCTPGFVMAMYALIRNNPKPSEDEILEAMQGNLCRCTGYRPILEAFYSFSVSENDELKIQETGCGMGENCCKVKKVNGKNGFVSNHDVGIKEIKREKVGKLTDLTKCSPYDATQELIFPPELKVGNFHAATFAYTHHETIWYQPTCLKKLLTLKRLHPHARIISGNSELAIELKFRFIDLKMVINPRQVTELHEIKKEEERGVYLGTGLSLTEMDTVLYDYSKTLPDEKTGVFKAVHEMMHWFAGKHVRNVASIAGNIATASPISDLNPVWMAANAQVVLESEERGVRTMPIDEKFFLGYRKTVIATDEIVKAIWVPYTEKNSFFAAYKQAQRREDDIAIVTGAFNVKFVPNSDVIDDIRISFGGMAPTTVLALKTMELLKGVKWSEASELALESLAQEFRLPPGVPGGMSRYRSALTLSFFVKFHDEVIQKKNGTFVKKPTTTNLEATQLFNEVSDTQPSHDPVGRPLQHVSGERHVTGEAKYCDDLNIPDCLHMAFVLSPIAKGQLDSVDYSDAIQMEGVVGYIDYKDVRSGARLGHVNDTPVFVESQISYHCQPIAAILAKDHETARRAANKVKVQTTREKAVVTIEDALEANSVLCPSFIVHSSLLQGDEVKVNNWSSYKRTVEGEVKMGGQEHFYLETAQCIVIPHEDEELEIIASTQGVNDVQMETAKILGIPAHKITARVRRIGGGFGGKESTTAILSAPAAIAAQKFRQPVRVKLERFDDMAITGNRHPFRFNYKVALDDNDKLIDYDVKAYSNSGHTFDLTVGVMHRCMVHIDNCYKFANADIEGFCMKTNIASNTAFRGFGGPQGMFCAETLMQHLSETYNIDHVELREKNFYEEGEKTPFGMTLSQCNIKRTWYECKEFSNFVERRKDVDIFNSKNKLIKKGIFLMPTRFGIGFGIKHLNQATALVLIYSDGSVLISHGGMEMGQGLHTKILQIAARCLDIPFEKVHIHESATDKVPNASATAASVGSDMNGLAVQDACNQINERLEPIKKEHPDWTWEQWIHHAYMERVSLSAVGYGILPYEAVDFRTGKGAELFSYCVYGTACCEVEVDCLTGDHKLLRTDIVMDVGDSLNPAIDIGQIEGAFVQGYGLFTMEELRVRPDGTRLTRGPGNYKIPSADDAPKHFNVSLLRGSSNKKAIFSSKAIGEPPLFLGACTYFAIREAIKAYRKDQGLDGYFRFDSPATAENIRLSCEDEYLKKIPKLPEAGAYTPWTVPL